jgi:hypothetical protein
MSRYNRYYPRDTEAVTDGDTAFVGVNAKLAPELLETGWVADATNITFRRGRAQTRGGLLEVADYAALRGSGIYSDPSGYEWLVLADSAGTVRRWRHGHTRRTVALPEGGEFAAGAKLDFVQAFASLLLFRGSEETPWTWDGTSAAGFEIADNSDPGDGTSPIPNGSDRRGLAPVLMSNRLLVPYGRDRIAVSDVLDFTRYDASLADFNVNAGNDDALSALCPFANATLLVFKDQSVHAIEGVAGDLSAARLTLINDTVGCIAGGTVAKVGGDVFWLGAGAVWRLTQAVQERLQTGPVPVSDAIEPILTQRVNWRAAGGAVASVLDEYFYLAVPIDGSTVNNAILPFNTQTGAWEGVHTFPIGLDALHVLDYLGRKRLFAVDFTTGRVCLLYAGREDCYGTTRAAISASLTTRAYGLGRNEVKQFRRCQVSLDAWLPQYTIGVSGDGVAEDTTLCLDRTKSRTAYTLHGRAAFTPTNAGDNHGADHREDYAWLLSDAAQLRSGIVPEREQSHIERFVVRQPARTMQVNILNELGTVSLGSIQLEGDEARRNQSPNV